MDAGILHPNNAKVLKIWNDDSEQNLLTGNAAVDLSLARNLFLIGLEGGNHWNFHYIGQTLQTVNEGLTAGDSFLKIWAASELTLMETILNKICNRHQSAVLRATAQTGDDTYFGTEILLLPIENKRSQHVRILGVYQPLITRKNKLQSVNQHNLGQFFFTSSTLTKPYLHLLIDNTQP